MRRKEEKKRRRRKEGNKEEQEGVCTTYIAESLKPSVAL